MSLSFFNGAVPVAAHDCYPWRYCNFS